jgi:hypothetical protein
VEWDVDRFAALKCHRGQVLVEERLEHDDLVTLLEKRGEHRVLAYDVF